MQEDKAYDRLNDEEFPGIIFARLTLYNTEPVLFQEEEVFQDYIEIKNFETYILRLFVYMAKELPAADKKGASDPFLIARCSG